MSTETIIYNLVYALLIVVGIAIIGFPLGYFIFRLRKRKWKKKIPEEIKQEVENERKNTEFETEQARRRYRGLGEFRGDRGGYEQRIKDSITSISGTPEIETRGSIQIQPASDITGDKPKSKRDWAEFK